ncbi:MAG: 30S ribosomal protein S2 [Pseudomonadota bacterium]
MAISVRDLLEAGAHFGHQTHRWNPKMRPYIYGARNGIYIIDLQQTAKYWRQAYDSMIETVRRGNAVLFVGTKPQAQEVIAEEATRAGQPFVNRRWLGGMLTNFKTIKNRIERYRELKEISAAERSDKYSKKDFLGLKKEFQKLEKSMAGISTMNRLPGLVVVVDPNREHLAVEEAKKLGLPIVSITDTNCDPDGIEYVVPANDDALKSIRLFIHEAAEACIEGQKAFELKIQEDTRRRMESKADSPAKKAEPEDQAAQTTPAATVTPDGQVLAAVETK